MYNSCCIFWKSWWKHARHFFFFFIHPLLCDLSIIPRLFTNCQLACQDRNYSPNRWLNPHDFSWAKRRIPKAKLWLPTLKRPSSSPLKTISCLILVAKIFFRFFFFGIGSELLKCKGDSYVDQDWFWVQDELNFLSSLPCYSFSLLHKNHLAWYAQIH